MYRDGGGSLVFPFLTPGSNQYDNVLWDWDSWLSNIALRQILSDIGTPKDKEEARRMATQPTTEAFRVWEEAPEKISEKLREKIPSKFAGEHPYITGVGTETVRQALEYTKPTTGGHDVILVGKEIEKCELFE